MDNILGCVMMAAITFPISFLAARSCLRGVIRLVTSGPSTSGGTSTGKARRDML
jgi:hypothetical protein